MKPLHPNDSRPKLLRLLLVEDSEDDALLLLHDLKSGGWILSSERVQTADALREALARESWDLIVCDHSMPMFDSTAALAIMRESALDIPFILVSGTLGEDAAVEAMRSGASDYFVKGRMTRLVPAIERELREAAGRRERREAQEFRERVTQSAIFGLVALDVEGRVKLANPRFCELTGYTVGELQGRPFARLLRPEEWERATCAIESVRRGATLPNLETELVAKDGRPMTLLFGWSPLIQDGVVVGLVGTGQDISDRKRLEAQVRQQQKMDAIGQMAGGIAHDFNNLLTAILGLVDMSLFDLPQGAARANVEQIRDVAGRAGELTRQLLAFARKDAVQPQVINLNLLIAHTEKLVRRLLSAGLELVTMLDEQLDTVRIDPGQFEQVLVNLVVNARDAMPGGGTVTIETANVTVDEAFAYSHPELRPGAHVMLVVRDTGAGIPAEIRDRIFEPFFTTKPRNHGTGLGLATVHGIVHQAAGYVMVESEVGVGTTFRIYLPCFQAPARRAQSQPQSPQSQLPAATGGDETVLLVEDDPTVRSVASRALRMKGYSVLEAESGADAIKLAGTHPGRIHLLVTDLVMPKQSGIALAGQLGASRPGVAVLYVSGYTDSGTQPLGRLPEEAAFLQKPFSPDSLARMVREVLDRPEDRPESWVTSPAS